MCNYSAIVMNGIDVSGTQHDFFSKKSTNYLKDTSNKNIDVQLAYTLSRVYNTYKYINNGGRYYPKFDRLHELNILGSYSINKNIKIGTSLINNWTQN